MLKPGMRSVEELVVELEIVAFLCRLWLCHHENSAKPSIKLRILITMPAISPGDRFCWVFAWATAGGVVV